MKPLVDERRRRDARVKRTMVVMGFSVVVDVVDVQVTIPQNDSQMCYFLCSVCVFRSEKSTGYI